MIKQKLQVFNDGILKIYSIEDISTPGRKPREGLKEKALLRCKRRTVGMSRFYVAMQNSVEISNLYRCQYQASVSTQDVAIDNSGKQYSIVQIQVPENISPPVMDLTLKEVEQSYGFA